MLGAGEIAFPREEHSCRFPNTKWSALKTYKQVSTQTERLYLGTYMFIHPQMELTRKEVMHLKASKKGSIGGFGGKGKEEIM